MKVKREESNLVIFEDTPMNNHINGELSTRRIHYMVFHRFIFKNSRIMLSPCFTGELA